jgi:hypothetical protein
MLLASTDQYARSPRPEGWEGATLAAHLLGGLETRLNHSAAVVAQIDRVAGLVEPEWRAAVKDAAWLHDVGYSPELVETGFHPLDGARWLRDHNWPAKTSSLVAWHTEPLEEARRHGLARQLAAEFDQPARQAAAALTWADLTSSPSGQRWDAERRLADILHRYPPSSLVHEATRASLPSLRRAVQEIEDLLGDRR